MANRETAAQKRQRISDLLADYDNRSRELNKLKKIVEGMKEQIKALPAATYGEWQLAFTPGRSIVDATALKALLDSHKLVTPMRTSDPSVVVVPVVSGTKK